MKTSGFLLAVACITAACGTPQQAASAPPAAPATVVAAADDGGATVTVQNIAFLPASLTVLRGTEVTWTSADANVRHTATSGRPGTRAIAGVSEGSQSQPDGLFDGDLPDTGSAFSFTFDDAGTYAYFCEIHPSMTADIVVE